MPRGILTKCLDCILSNQCAQISGMEKIVTRRVTVETRLKCVTREQDAVHPGVRTVGQEMLVMSVSRFTFVII